MPGVLFVMQVLCSAWQLQFSRALLAPDTLTENKVGVLRSE